MNATGEVLCKLALLLHDKRALVYKTNSEKTAWDDCRAHIEYQMAKLAAIRPLSLLPDDSSGSKVSSLADNQLSHSSKTTQAHVDLKPTTDFNDAELASIRILPSLADDNSQTSLLSNNEHSVGTNSSLADGDCNEILALVLDAADCEVGSSGCKYRKKLSKAPTTTTRPPPTVINNNFYGDVRYANFGTVNNSPVGSGGRSNPRRRKEKTE